MNFELQSMVSQQRSLIYSSRYIENWIFYISIYLISYHISIVVQECKRKKICTIYLQRTVCSSYCLTQSQYSLVRHSFLSSQKRIYILLSKYKFFYVIYSSFPLVFRISILRPVCMWTIINLCVAQIHMHIYMRVYLECMLTIWWCFFSLPTHMFFF